MEWTTIPNHLIRKELRSYFATPKAAVRIGLAAILLAVVFEHAHWSVGVCLTLSMVNAEITTMLLRLTAAVAMLDKRMP